MPRRLLDEEEDEEPKGLWKGLVLDLLVAGIIVVIVLVAIYAYTGIWPPLVVVESQSMQHSGKESYLGVIDTGDMVFQQAAPDRASVITYIQGRASGYATYGDYGDVIIFHPRGDVSVTPVIHRAILWARPNGTGFADVPDLSLLPASEWTATGGQGPNSPYHIESAKIREMGFNHNLIINFTFSSIAGFGSRGPGFVTMGDYNAFTQCQANTECQRGYDPGWFAIQSDIIGRARGEIPWFGLLKLTLQPTDSCCKAWGDTEAPKNSWDSLVVSLVVLFALPFILEYGVRGWKKYVSPRLPEIRWPWQRAKAKSGPGSPGEVANGSSKDPRRRPRKPPREGSSEP